METKVLVLWALSFLLPVVLCARIGDPDVEVIGNLEGNASSGLITAPFRPCPRKCEVRFPDGICRLNFTCVLEHLLLHNNTEDFTFLYGQKPCGSLCTVVYARGVCATDVRCLRRYPTLIGRLLEKKDPQQKNRVYGRDGKSKYGKYRSS